MKFFSYQVRGVPISINPVLALLLDGIFYMVEVTGMLLLAILLYRRLSR